MASLAERYEAGEHRQVWDELVDLGPDVMEPPWRADAEQVAFLTMGSAAANVATLVVRLTAMGYRFGSRFDFNRRRRSIEELGVRASMEAAGKDVSWVDQGDVEESVMGWTGARPHIADAVALAERVVGPLPLSVRALALFVDRVDLSGSFSTWEPSAYHFDDESEWAEFGVFSDPLNVTGIDVVNEYLQPGAERIDPVHFDREGRFPLPVGCDHVLAANLPGALHTVTVPDRSADAVVHGVLGRPGIRLVEYLRVSFEWGGFPGFEFADTAPREIEVLRRGLLPI